MTEVQVLYLILAGIYLLQCIGWAPLESEVLRIGRRFRATVLHRELPLRFGQHKLFLLNPFLPLAGAFVLESFPSVRNSDEGISTIQSTASRSSTLSGRRTISMNWQEKHKIRNAGKEVRSADHVLFIAHTEAYANFLAGLFDRVRRKSPKERDRAFEHEFEKMFDTKEVTLRLEKYRSESAFLRAACVLLFVFLFLMVPVLIWLRGIERIWPLLFAYLVWLLAWIGWSFLRAHRELYPGQKDGRWQHVIVLALSPFSAIRANDVLLRDLFCAFHPLAVDNVLLSKEEFRLEAERALRQSVFRADRHISLSDVAMGRALESFLAETGMLSEELLRSPHRESQNCLTYCPLCLAQFVVAEGECPDCGEVKLKTFPPESACARPDRTALGDTARS